MKTIWTHFKSFITTLVLLAFIGIAVFLTVTAPTDPTTNQVLTAFVTIAVSVISFYFGKNQAEKEDK